MKKMVWRIQLLGGLRATCSDRTVERFRTKKAGLLLAYLAHYPQPHPREVLAEILWPEDDPATARTRLRIALASLRRQLEPPGTPSGSVIRASRGVIQLDGAACLTDLAEFEAALQAAEAARSSVERVQQLARAVQQYGGELLPGYFESWILRERQRRAEQFHQALSQLVRGLEQSGDLESAIDWARHAVAADPLREEAQHELIRLLATTGQREAALRQYRELERLLRRELGEAPSVATRDLLHRPSGGRRREGEGVTGRGGEGATGREGEHEHEHEQEHSSVGAPRRPVTPSPRVSLVRSPPRAVPPPAGTVTFLLTDIEGSTALWERSGEAFRTVLATHHALLRREFELYGGYEFKEAGDSFVIAFVGVSEAVACAIAAQRVLAEQAWPESVGPLRVRMALHTGDVEREKGEYRGLVLHHAARMLVAAHGGQIVCSEVSAGLLGHADPGSLEPDVQIIDLGRYRLRDVAVPQRLFQVVYPGMPLRVFPPLAVTPAHEGHLPLQLTRFFDRDADIARLCQILVGERENRLVTLTGLGGSGKSRLALEVAHRLAERFSRAVYFVPLADVNEPALILQELRDVLQIPIAPTTAPLESITEMLAHQPVLLILDNFEHLLDGGVSMVLTLLERLPMLTCLVTSRQPLGITGEREFTVAPLAVPDDQDVGSRVKGVEGKVPEFGPDTLHPTPDTLAQFPSVQLFVDRAQAVRPDFQVTPHNAAAVAELCRRLDGIPLALELAAARARTLTVPQMLAQLESTLASGGTRFDLLTSRRRDLPERHRTLRAALDWSYHLLSPELQRFFAHLSLFRGGFALQAAAAVCVDNPPSKLEDALACLEELQRCSLILTEDGGEEMRFRLLETVRAYAGEQLSPEERVTAARRHAAYYLHLAEQAEPELRGPRQAAWIRRLTAKEENLRAALVWSVANGVPEWGLRMTAALVWFWHGRGLGAEMRARLAELLRLAESKHGEPGAGEGSGLETARAHGIYASGHLALMQTDLPAAAAFLEESVAIHLRLNDKKGLALSLDALSGAAMRMGQLDRARSHLWESLKVWGELGDRWGMGEALGGLASIADMEGNYPLARERYEEALAIYREIGDSQGIGWVLNSLGQVVQRQGDLEAAQALHEQSLAVWQELGNSAGAGWSLMNLAHLARARGDLEMASALYDAWEAAAPGSAPGSPTPWMLYCRGRLAVDRREPGAAHGLFEKALYAFQLMGDQSGIAHCHLNLGRAARLSGDLETARDRLTTALPMFQSMNDRWGVVLSLEAFADLAAARGQSRRAARLLAAADSLRARLGAPRPPVDRPEYERLVAELRAALGDDALAAARAEGSALSLEQAGSEALQGSE